MSTCDTAVPSHQFTATQLQAPIDLQGSRSLAKGFTGSLIDKWAQYRQRRIDRQAFQHLLSLDEALLCDIGVTRDDVKWANKLPLSQNASQELYAISLARRGQHPQM